MKIKTAAALVSLLAGASGLSAASRRAVAAREDAAAWGTPVDVGFHYPGVSARVTYGHAGLEGLYMKQDGADAYGPRIYYIFNPGSRVVFNGGAEYAWVKGKTELQKYAGKAMTGFLGMEVFASRRTSVGIDMGYCRVSLEGDGKADVAEDSLVANIGLHLYL